MLASALERKFVSDCGPRQHKAASKAISAYLWRGKTRIEIVGVHGGESHEHELTGMMDQPRQDCIDGYERLGERFGWEITRDNYKAVIAAFEDATRELVLPIDDKRISQEQKAENKRAVDERLAKEQQQREQRDKVKGQARQLAKGRKGWVYAELHEDNSDSMSDYFAHNVTRRVLIGFTGSSRTNFKLMRKLAAQFPPTSHLGPDADKSVEHRENYSMGGGNYVKDGSRHGSGWAVRMDSEQYCEVDEIAEHLTSPPDVVSPESSVAMTVEKHYHSKRECDFWICILTDEVEYDEFNRLRQAAQSAGGWYSRKFGSTPAGFAFLSEAAANTFAGIKSPVGSCDDAHAISCPLGHLADLLPKLERDIENLAADRMENTPKRQREGMARRMKLRHHQRAKETIEKLAAMETVPAELMKFRTKSSIFKALETSSFSNGYYHVGDTYEFIADDVASKALQNLLDYDRAQQKAEDDRKTAEAQVCSDGIPGFFPTPDDLADEMLSYCDPLSRSFLEPSAGKGDLCRAISRRNPTAVIIGCEINSTLRDMAADHCNVLFNTDFIKAPVGRVDCVVMNPPYESEQDCDHVRHAYKWLNDGGRLVALMAGSTIGATRGRRKAFLEWLDEVDGVIEPLGQRFKNGDVATGVNCCLVVIDKGGE